MMGRPRFPSVAQIDTLKEIAVPRVEFFQEKAAEGFITLSFEMKKNEITLLEIYPVKEEKQGYDGLDDNKLTSYSDL